MKFKLIRHNTLNLALFRKERINSHLAIDFENLVDPSFMIAHTAYLDVFQWLSSNNLPLHTPTSYSLFNKHRLNSLVRESTAFKDWDDMLQCAINTWISKNGMEQIKTTG